MKSEKNRVALNEEEGRPTEPGTDADVHYDFSQFGLDRAVKPSSPGTCVRL